MTLLLVGDVGGTKTLLRLVEMPTGETSTTASQQKNLYEALYTSQEYPDLVPMVREFLQAAAAASGSSPTPTKACFAIAGPVVGHTSVLTNLAWSLTTERLEQELNIAHVSLINDFAAVGYGLLSLTPEDILTLQPGRPQSTAPIAVIGAGTGLGEGFLVRLLDDYHVYATEGGHADFAPRTDMEFELLQYFHQHYHLDRVSVERVVSGQGIVTIYQFLCDRAQDLDRDRLSAASEHSTNLGANLTKKDRHLSAAEISQAALEKSNPICQQTMELFIEAYGAEAGNLALKLLPYGGLYLAGGIAAKILPLIKEGDRFLNAFKQKGRMSSLLERIPVHIVKNPQVGLQGAAVCASRL
ncbi:glucokinase [Planktothricoides raciborskii]|uniref:Glucokinase n=1 Tax=Planktothricoides raciborskii GIHE-MW2 TaxID=2792601 RepID=A0AAU8J8Q3_9CYAN